MCDQVDRFRAVGDAESFDGLNFDAGRNRVGWVLGCGLAYCVDVVTGEEGRVACGQPEEGREEEQSCGAVHLSTSLNGIRNTRINEISLGVEAEELERVDLVNYSDPSNKTNGDTISVWRASDRETARRCGNQDIR